MSRRQRQVNKNYVDGEISKITTVDTNQFVLKSGSTMTGDLNMNNHLITNVKNLRVTQTLPQRDTLITLWPNHI